MHDPAESDVDAALIRSSVAIVDDRALVLKEGMIACAGSVRMPLRPTSPRSCAENIPSA
jgi:hypothetical protein